MRFDKIARMAVMLGGICCSLLSGQEQTSRPTKESCLAFVQDFYRWYVPKAQDTNVNSLDLVLKERRFVFSPRLFREVVAVETDARSKQEAGLDFDWILNSQDPGDLGDPGYLVRNNEVKGNVCRVDAYRQLDQGKTEKMVTPELVFENGRWLFVNFHYPDGRDPRSENLLAMTRTYLDSIRKSKGNP